MTRSALQQIAQEPTPTPRMSSAEIGVFVDLMRETNCYLEYGAGGSTILAVKSPVKQIVSVETDFGWIELLQKNEVIAAAIGSRRLTFRHIDVGPVGGWGVPKGEEKIRNWPRYALDPFLSTDLDFDTILVDGRFRVHCLLAIVNCASQKARIFLHDYSFRHGYSIADKYFDTIERVDSSVVLKIRADVNHRSLYIDLISSLFAV